MLGERRQVVEHLGSRRQVAFFPGLASAARQHEYRLRPRGRGGGDIAVRVADHVGVLERDIEAPRYLEKHPRLRLAAGAARLCLVGGEEKNVDGPSLHMSGG